MTFYWADWGRDGAALGFGTARAPVLGRESHAPETRSRLDKLDADLSFAFGHGSDVHYFGLKLLVRFDVAHDDRLTECDIFSQKNQCPMRVDGRVTVSSEKRFPSRRPPPTNIFSESMTRWLRRWFVYLISRVGVVLNGFHLLILSIGRNRDFLEYFVGSSRTNSYGCPPTLEKSKNSPNEAHCCLAHREYWCLSRSKEVTARAEFFVVADCPKKAIQPA
jgi:hypothetical protein